MIFSEEKLASFMRIMWEEMSFQLKKNDLLTKMGEWKYEICVAIMKDFWRKTLSTHPMINVIGILPNMDVMLS